MRSGAESWLTMSLLQTRKYAGNFEVWDGEGVVSEEVGDFRGPTDQLFTVGLYFKDYFPNYQGYKVHLNAFMEVDFP